MTYNRHRLTPREQQELEFHKANLVLALRDMPTIARVFSECRGQCQQYELITAKRRYDRATRSRIAAKIHEQILKY